MNNRYFIFRINSYGVCAEICADEAFYEDVARLRQLFTDARMLEVVFDAERFTRVLYPGALPDEDEWSDVCRGCVIMRVAPVPACEDEEGDDENVVSGCSLRMIVDKDGFTLSVIRNRTTYSSNHISWLAVGADKAQDLLRCRYFDCVEAHPPAADDELVTCHTCRKEMGLAG